MNTERLAHMLATLCSMQDRASRIRKLRHERQRAIFDAAFGKNASIAYGPAHLAHNWQSLPNLTPTQRSACRMVLWLEKGMGEALRIVDRWYVRQMNLLHEA